MSRFAFLAALALGAVAAPAAAQTQSGDNLVYVAADDADMNAAIAQGRKTLPDFFAHFAHPAGEESGFLIKYDLLPEPDRAEFIWAEVISHAPGVTIARLANTPEDARWTIGEKVSVTDREIVDWGYFRGSVMQGNFTTRALLPHMDKSAADAIRGALGW